MTDRGLPIVDGAPACPFVAFDEERDARALAPDHRHRCFAEARPAPRALAHQEAYCLSSAFPVCPTFQDWARREAAAVRSSSAPGAADDRAQREEPPVGRPLPLPEREPRHAPDVDVSLPIPPHRNPPRGWAAPPPWAGGSDGDPEDAEPPAFLAGRDQRRDDLDRAAASLGLAGSAADRLASPDPDAVPAHDRPGRPFPPPEVTPERAYADEGDYEEPEDWAAPPVPPTRAVGRSVGRSAPPLSRRDQARRRSEEEAAELFGPAWERPHRYEAYPSLRTRIGLGNLPSLSGMGVGLAALVLAGVVLFFVGPMLLGIGGKAPGPAGAASPAASGQSTPAPVPTPSAAPTATTYVVVKNDVMSKIATKFGVTLAQLLAANPQIKNPDKIAEGDVLNIPAPLPSEVPGVVGGSTVPSSPAGSAAP